MNKFNKNYSESLNKKRINPSIFVHSLVIGKNTDIFAFLRSITPKKPKTCSRVACLSDYWRKSFQISIPNLVLYYSFCILRSEMRNIEHFINFYVEVNKVDLIPPKTENSVYIGFFCSLND